MIGGKEYVLGEDKKPDIECKKNIQRKLTINLFTVPKHGDIAITETIF